MSKIAIIGTGKTCAVNIGDLARSLMIACENEETNPINLGITMNEYIKVNEIMSTNQEKKSNGFLEGKKMNRILGKRK